jgi:ATP-dependent Lon protease
MDNNTRKLTEITTLLHKLQNAKAPPELKLKAYAQLERIALAFKFGGNVSQLDVVSKYIDYIDTLPWEVQTIDILDIEKVKKEMDEHHYGLEAIKNRIIEFISIIKLHKEKGDGNMYKSPVLLFVGLAGTGKSSIAPSIAKALGRKFYRIPFGGLSSALDIRGQSKTGSEAEPGAIIKALKEVGSNNPVILLDELDRVAPESKAAIMGVLLELLDPGQNKHFTDYFLDYPFNLGNVLFIATANNTTNVSTAVLDRMEVIHMPSYTDEEKIYIAKHFVMPKALQEAGLAHDSVSIADELWPAIIRPLGFESGIRGVEKMIEDAVRKFARMQVEENVSSFSVNESNIGQFFIPPVIG